MVVRIDGVVAGEQAFLLEIAGVLARGVVNHLLHADTLRVVDEIGQCGMLRREDQTRRAINCVDARCEHAKLAIGAFKLEIDLCALGAADPVALHGEDALRPTSFELFEIFQQFAGVFGDAQEPLGERALFHRRGFVAPATTVHHLLVGQHGAAFRAPVQQRLFAVSETALQHAQKEPLIPAIVFGLACRDFTRPVITEAHAAELALHGLDVCVGPLARVAVVLDGRVLGGKAEGVPSHGVQDVEAAHPFIAGQGVADGVVADVAYVQRSARVGQHLQHVILRAGGIFLGLVESGIVVPALVPLQFQRLWVVLLLRHRIFGYEEARTREGAA